MTVVHFYEKPGCLTNAKQKKLLAAAGHLLVVHDLLAEPWKDQRDTLRAFFGSLPVAQWFNASAPDIKNGNVNTDILSEQQALELMAKQPLLIRRPLLEIDGKRYTGFDAEHLNRVHGMGLKIAEGDQAESCAKPTNKEACGS
jgi:nitrogenase-associated protein